MPDGGMRAVAGGGMPDGIDSEALTSTFNPNPNLLKATLTLTYPQP